MLCPSRCQPCSSCQHLGSYHPSCRYEGWYPELPGHSRNPTQLVPDHQGLWVPPQVALGVTLASGFDQNQGPQDVPVPSWVPCQPLPAASLARRGQIPAVGVPLPADPWVHAPHVHCLGKLVRCQDTATAPPEGALQPALPPCPGALASRGRVSLQSPMTLSGFHPPTPRLLLQHGPRADGELGARLAEPCPPRCQLPPEQQLLPSPAPTQKCCRGSCLQDLLFSTRILAPGGPSFQSSLAQSTLCHHPGPATSPGLCLQRSWCH